MNPNRNTCIIYTTATCNLKCKYCYIDKSPILVKIDKILEESYSDDYYFNFMKKMFEKTSLRRMEIWGGEPTYGLCRAKNTVINAIKYFPNLTEFFFSTNLTTETCVNDIINFYSIFKQFPERQFQLGLQLSIDGPQKINDFNRGEGVTLKFTKNFNKLLLALKEFLPSAPNISINAHFKPTLDAYGISQLQTKKSIIEFYKFLESYKKLSDSIFGLSPQWSFHPGIPNTATPSPHTTNEGKEFANLCKLINEIMEEHLISPIFYYYTDIMPFHNYAAGEQYELCHGCATCGTGSINVGLLPNDMISGCHNGFTELLEEYKKHAPEQTDYQIDINLFKYAEGNNMIFTIPEYEEYEKQTALFHCQNSTFQITEMAAVIQRMAYLNQVDAKYQDIKEAVSGAHFIQRVTSSCLRDNMGVTGSKYLFQLGFPRLFLNGAKEEIQKHASPNF